ncbi:MAG: hypothetical protein MJ200_04235 [Mycoplasmoidaceae bacterium]|nr:hypothetical protein [Mycoplasmoidaceae bacterium]
MDEKTFTLLYSNSDVELLSTAGCAEEVNTIYTGLSDDMNPGDPVSLVMEFDLSLFASDEALTNTSAGFYCFAHSHGTIPTTFEFNNMTFWLYRQDDTAMSITEYVDGNYINRDLLLQEESTTLALTDRIVIYCDAINTGSSANSLFGVYY